MSKEIERLRLAAEASASVRIREELQEMSGKELAQALYHATVAANPTGALYRNDIISECMHRLESLGATPDE